MEDTTLREALRELAESGGKVKVADYKKLAGDRDDLPSLGTVYRRYGSFPELLESAGLAAVATVGGRPRKEYVGALQLVILKLGGGSVTTEQYDEFRRVHEPDMPSSTSIRENLGGRWETALDVAAGGDDPNGEPVRESPGFDDWRSDAPGDELHPTEPWSRTEVVRLADALERRLKDGLTSEAYERLRGRSDLPLPPWVAVMWARADD